MDFEFTTEQTIFRRTLREFLEKEVKPHVDRLDREEEFPLTIFRRMGELGFLGLTFPEEVGGGGGDFVTLALFVEEMARVSPGVASTAFVSAFGGGMILTHVGSEEHRRQYLAPVLQGEKIWANAVTEPNAGSDVSAIESTARLEGDHYVLNGRKIFITNGSLADLISVAAVTDKKAGRKGISLFLVEKGRPGFSIGRKLEKMGWRCSDTAELVFEDCRVPRQNLLGEEGRGFHKTLEFFAVGRVFTGAIAVGTAQGAWEEALRYAQERRQFGRPIGKFQAIRHKLADMATEIEAARMLVYHGAWLADQGQDIGKVASMAKLYASELAHRVAIKCVQIHGGYGVMMEFPVQRFFRDASVLGIVEGTSDIQREIIAKQLDL